MRKKVLITGAGGYIGRHVVQTALDQGCDVYANDFQTKGIDARATIVDVPIFSNDADIYQQLGCPDVLIHMAWQDGFIHNSPEHMKNLSSHIVFLNRMIDAGLPSLSVMGSMHEIGYWEGPITSKTTCNPQNLYGVAKNALRQALLLYTREKSTNLKWLRAYYIYGDDTRGSSIFAKLTQAAKEGKKEFPFTSGKNKNDFITVHQLSKQIVAASLQNDLNGIINVCTGTAVSLAERVEAYIRENQLDIKLVYGAFPDRPYDSPGVWGDATEINEIMRMFKENPPTNTD